MGERGELLWTPPDDRGQTRLGRYIDWLATHDGPTIEDYSYRQLWRWSIDDLDAFWGSIWDYFDLQSATPPDCVIHDTTMPGARWFPGATLNYAPHALQGPPDETVVVARSQTRGPRELTRAELADQVARCQAGLERLGVGPGDRVAAYLPNIPETIVAFLATASLGAIWSSCAPEFGIRSVLDRFRQIEPTVLFAVDGYRYGSKTVDRSAEVAAIREGLPSLRHVVTVPYLDPDARLGDLVWDEVVDSSRSEIDLRPSGYLSGLDPVPVAFDHPLYVLYSSGTTGLPKAIVHGHGGILIEHYKALGLHCDLGPGDRFFWFSTTGWMMWNFLVSGLLVGAAVVLFDGDPGAPDLDTLWDVAAETGVTYFGASAPFLMACRKAGIVPARDRDLAKVRTVGSTGAPLPPEGFRWVYEQFPPEVLLSSISGGTDVCTAFVGGTPLMPVRAGELSCSYLGAKVEAYNEWGNSVVGELGELVLIEPMPSMPVGFWGDDGRKSRYRAAYFDKYPGMWTHGDWITLYEDGACVVSGRSDATLNRGGVRMGTAELYSVVEAQPQVADSLVIHLEDPEDPYSSGTLVLFVALADGHELDDALKAIIKSRLRTELSPRHVPDDIYEAPGIPRTLSGKKLEVPVKRILQGADPDVAASRGSLANPEALDFFRDFECE